MKLHTNITLTLCILVIAFAKPARSLAFKENWSKVVSTNFIVVSDAGEDEARKVAAMLEQFRHTALMILPQSKIKAPLPTNVFYFRSHGSFRESGRRSSEGAL